MINIGQIKEQLIGTRIDSSFKKARNGGEHWVTVRGRHLLINGEGDVLLGGKGMNGGSDIIKVGEKDKKVMNSEKETHKVAQSSKFFDIYSPLISHLKGDLYHPNGKRADSESIRAAIKSNPTHLSSFLEIKPSKDNVYQIEKHQMTNDKVINSYSIHSNDRGQYVLLKHRTEGGSSKESQEEESKKILAGAEKLFEANKRLISHDVGEWKDQPEGIKEMWIRNYSE